MDGFHKLGLLFWGPITLPELYYLGSILGPLIVGNFHAGADLCAAIRVHMRGYMTHTYTRLCTDAYIDTSVGICT